MKQIIVYRRTVRVLIIGDISGKTKVDGKMFIDCFFNGYVQYHISFGSPGRIIQSKSSDFHIRMISKSIGRRYRISQTDSPSNVKNCC